MKKWLFLLLPVMVFFLFNCAGPIVQVSYDIQGTVKKSDGTPLQNVTVVAGTKQAQTNVNGEWSITGLTGNVTVSAQLQDYYIVVSGTVNLNKQVSSQATIDFTAYSETENFGGGEGTSDDPYIIVTAQQLNNVRNHLDKHFRQIRDIDLDDLKIRVDPVEYNWTPVATDDNEAFTGSYDGKGFEIKNALIGGRTDSDEYFGFFAYVNGATIKNIILKNFQVNYEATYSGIFAGGIESSIIENIVIDNSTITKSSYIGGFAGYTSSSTITNCTIKNTTVKADPDNGGSYVGGFVADANATLFENCSMRNVQVHSANYSYMMGGFVASSSISGFRNCSFEGTIDATATYVGGFVGYASWHEEEPGKMAFDTFQDCSVVNAQMSARRKPSEMSGYVGGFVGWIEDVHSFEGCTVSMDITTDLDATYVAGFVGYVNGSKEVKISKSSFEGSINATDDYISVSGFAIAYSKVLFDECYTKFEIQTPNNAEISGFLILVGDVYDIDIKNSYARGDINSGTGSHSAGFIIMNSDVHPNVENCYSAVSSTENSNYRYAFVYNSGLVNTSNCFYDIEISNAEDDRSDAQGKETEEMKTQSTYTDWDFVEIWDISPDNYPHLRWEN